MNDSEISIEMFDVSSNIVVTITVEDLRELCFKDGACWVDVEIELESMECSCGDNDL